MIAAATIPHLATAHFTIVRKLIHLFHSMACLFIDFQKCYPKMIHLFFSFFFTLIFKFSDTDADLSERETCISCKNITSASFDELDIDDQRLTIDDAKMVLCKLGLLNEEDDDLGNDFTFEEGKCGDCWLMDEANKLLEEKEAIVEELEEAFKVYDRNGDGYITPSDIRRVMVMLGIIEGMRLECCKRMVQAFDQDGDGRICFNEFKMMMECSN